MKHFYKTFIAAAVLMMASASVWAANYHSLHISLKDGSVVSVNLSDELKASFTETHLHIESEGPAVDVPRADIAGLAFKEEAGIEDAETAAPAFDGDNMTFTGLPAGSVVSVFATDGRAVASATAEGEFTLPLASLPAGVYIVTVNNMSYKISVK